MLASLSGGRETEYISFSCVDYLCYNYFTAIITKSAFLFLPRRKEIISHVRNAAEVALGLIDSEKSREALRVTKVLSSEMKDLKDSK